MLTQVAINAAASRIEVAAEQVRDALAKGQVQTEDDFTSRLIDRIEREVDGQSIGGFQWRAMKLTDRGPSSQEHEFGADILGVLEVQTRKTRFAKGLLVQAKLLRPPCWSNTKELRAQCELMLRRTPDSYVFAYATTGVEVFSALVVARSQLQLQLLPHWTLRRFFVAHFSSFIGDERIAAPSQEALEKLRGDGRLHVLHLTAEQVSPR